MTELVDRLNAFIEYWRTLSGDEKGEAQVFCDRLLRAFGHEGYKEAGATLEHRVKHRGDVPGTRFADLVWKPRVLIEMKKRGEKLRLHFRQAFQYWERLVPDRPRYVVLCNFDEFHIYDFDKQIDEPVDTLLTEELPKRYSALGFLFPDNRPPLFRLDREGTTRDVAGKVGEVFRALVKNGESRERAQRFVLQTVVAMFAEDMDLMPRGIVTRLVEDCFAGQSSYDLFGALFAQMNTPKEARAGRFKGVPYFDGGLFAKLEPIELKVGELTAIRDAAEKDWSAVNPAIFGNLFQSSMDEAARHKLGAHFTSELDIMKVVGPTITQPWVERIDNASSVEDLLALREEMLAFRVLDPACGSGNFLYVAYRELVRLEIGLLDKVRRLLSPAVFKKTVGSLALVSPRQFYGLDLDSFAIELAKVTLLFAKKFALDDALKSLGLRAGDPDLSHDQTLPLDNLDANLVCADALFTPWPAVDAIVGNPPYQSKNKMQAEFGRAYVNKLHKEHPEVPGRADFCVYWFRKSHDHLELGQRAGLVGTNTIRQNYSREGGLDYIVDHGGTITDAVSTQAWTGDAAVHVSIVNWVKGEHAGPKRLARQIGDGADSPWQWTELDSINSALSFGVDVTDAETLAVASAAGGCYQGQTHGHEGFLLMRAEAEAELKKRRKSAQVLFPYLTADELIGNVDSLPSRHVIDFAQRDLLESSAFAGPFKHVQELVLPDRRAAAERELQRSDEARKADPSAKTNKHHANFLASWWQLSYARADLMQRLQKLNRYVVCGRVTKRPIFEFVDPRIHPNDALMVIPYEDDYSFGILQSGPHWEWFKARCSTLGGTWRYTSNSVFDSFAWPQSPSTKQVRAVADAAVALRVLRWNERAKHKLSLRDLYRSLELPGESPLKKAQADLDRAVRAAYGMSANVEPLAFLVGLNHEVAATEKRGDAVTGPGLPAAGGAPKSYVTGDCVRMPKD